MKFQILKLGKHVFFGWWVVVSCAILALWSGALSYGMTAFVKPVADDRGWSYLAISIAASIRSVELGLLSPVTGFLSDKFGPRKVTFVSCLLCGIGLILLSQTSSIFTFYIAFIVIGIALSGIGQSVTTTAVVNWFKKKAGKATGFAIAGYGIGGIIIPLIAWLIIQYGWRIALIVLGVSTWVFILPLTFLLRHKPEQYGYSIDDEKASVSGNVQNQADIAPDTRSDFTTRKALKTFLFWALAVTFALQYMVLQGVTLHIMPYCSIMHLPEGISAIIAMCIPLSSVIGRLSFGYLSDKFNKKYILTACILLQFIGLFLLYYGGSIWFIIAFLVFYGPTFGGSLVLRSTITRDYYGRSSFGTIQGLILAVMTPFGLIGPAFAGWIFDISGSYQIAWLVFAAATLPTAILMLFAMKNLDKDK